MLLDTYFPSSVPEGNAIVYISKKRKIPCHEIFLAAAGKATNGKLPPDERLEILNFAKAACDSNNPDIIWQIAHVESAFKMKVVHIDGKSVLTGENAKKYLLNGLLKNENVDIGPLQINWRANGSRFDYHPSDFLNGEFSVDFLKKHILKDYVLSCKENWINCYHSYNKTKGNKYREKIQKSGVKLKEILSGYL